MAVKSQDKECQGAGFKFGRPGTGPGRYSEGYFQVYQVGRSPKATSSWSYSQQKKRRWRVPSQMEGSGGGAEVFVCGSSQKMGDGLAKPKFKSDVGVD